MKINTKNVVYIFLLIVAVGVVLTSGYMQKPVEKTTEPQIPLLSTTPVSQGYIQSFNHDFGYGYEYPENWTMRGSDYFHMTGGILNAEMFVNEPEATSITVIAKNTTWKDLEEAKAVIRDAYRENILDERMIEINGIKGYELTRESSPSKFKMVIFYVNGRIYEFDYGADEPLYDAYESIFDHVVNSFNVN